MKACVCASCVAATSSDAAFGAEFFPHRRPRVAQRSCEPCAPSEYPLIDSQFSDPGAPAVPQAPARVEAKGEADQAESNAETSQTGSAADFASLEAFASSFGVAAAPMSSAPNMLGDFFGGTTGSGAIVATGPGRQVTAIYRSAYFADPGNNPDGGPVFLMHPGGGALGFPELDISFLPTSAVDTDGDSYNDTVRAVPAPHDLADALINNLGAGQLTFVDGFLVITLPAGVGSFDSNGDGIDDSSQSTEVGGTAGPPGAGQYGDDDDFESLADVQYTYFYAPGGLHINVPSPGAGAGVGRVKLAENTSPLPRDRVFINYSYFDNVALTSRGVNVNRFVPGFEKTFFDRLTSFELRTPFASTLDSNISADGVTSDSNVEFGNISMIFKGLVHQTDTWAYSTGLQLTLPTADDVNVRTYDGTDVIRVENQSVHVMPFFGAIYAPNDRFFAQGFVQFDFDSGGNPVYVTDFTDGLSEVGRINDVNFLYVDVGVGYWAYRNEGRGSGLWGIAPTVELHYNSSLQETDVVQAGPFQVGNFADNIEILNLVVGSTFAFGERTMLTAGYATPIAGGVDKNFDGELRVLFNYAYGPQSRFTRAQF